MPRFTVEVTIGVTISGSATADQESAMGEPFPAIESPENRLDSWKEIAAYLDRDVTTAQRWEKREGMPVHRHLHDRAGSVYAFRTELDAWVRTRNLRAAQTHENNNNPSPTPARSPTRPAASGFRPHWRFAFPLLAAAALGFGVSAWLKKAEYFWRSPLADARFQTVTNFEGAEEGAAISRDGHFVAFLSNRGGQTDIWVTQPSSGQLHNLTRGKIAGLVNNPLLRTLAFSPDGSLVTFWLRNQHASKGVDISVWAVPTLGGEAEPYLQNVAEFDWAHDGSRLAYHTPDIGDPLFVSRARPGPKDRLIFTAPAGQHSHFPLWAPDASFIYFVHGSVPDELDIWRIRPSGGTAERITSHNARVSHPVLLDRRTLLYLATNPDGSGPSLYSIDVDRRIPHKLTSGPDVYTSLAASADTRRLVLTLTSPKKTLWRLRIGEPLTGVSVPEPISLTTSTGFSPRLGPDFLLYVSATGAGESIWNIVDGTSAELWNGEGARVIGSPAISPDGRHIAFSVRQLGRSLLYVMRADGTNARIICDSLSLRGAPAWAPDGQSITTAAEDHGVPHLFRVPVNGRSPAVFTEEYSIDPVWAPDGHFVVYSGPDVGTSFAVKAATVRGAAYPAPAFMLARGARRLAFASGGREIVLLRGDIRHKNLWALDLQTGAERQLTNFSPDFDVSDFDISPEGHELVLERAQERSDVVLLDLPRR